MMSNWNPTDDFAIRLSDETGEERTESQLDKMVEQIQDIANAYDFDLSVSGGWPGIRRLAVLETDGMKKYEELDKKAADPRPMSTVRFSDECYPEEYRGGYPMNPEHLFIYLGEIPNMEGHCVVMDNVDSQIYSGYHIELFTEINEDGDF
jgi:hypothetical protein